jgi:hypothetical protein
MITKSEIATILGIDNTDIAESIYTWAVKQFFILTGFKEIETQKTERRLIQSATNILKLRYKNIKQIDSIKLDNITQTFTLYTDLKFNPDTGVVWYSTGFGGGQLAEITYTLLAYTEEDIHDYLITLLVAKSLSIFSPEKVSQIKMIKIGSYQKQYGTSSSNLEEFITVTDSEIQQVINSILGDDGRLDMGLIQ